VVQDAGAACGSGGGSTITAGTTPTSGITSGHLIGSSGNLVVDAGWHVAQTWAQFGGVRKAVARED
jgi:hypothetical protein